MKNKSNFAQFFINRSNVSVIKASCLTQYLNRVFRMSTRCSNTLSKSSQNDIIAVISMNSHSKSFHIVNKRIFLSQHCWPDKMCISDSIPALHPVHDNPLAYQSGSLSVVFSSEYQFSYLFTSKSLLLRLKSSCVKAVILVTKSTIIMEILTVS